MDDDPKAGEPDNLEGFRRWVMEGFDPDRKFEPFACRNIDGDAIEFFVSNESYYGKYIDDRLTVYIGCDSGEVVGGWLAFVSRYRETR